MTGREADETATCKTIGCEKLIRNKRFREECVAISSGRPNDTESTGEPVNRAGAATRDTNSSATTPRGGVSFPRNSEDEPLESDLAEVPRIETNTYPENLTGVPWFAWKPTSDGRKVPRAPWFTGGDAFVSAQDSEVWTDRETAERWIDTLPGYGLAINIRDREEYPEEKQVLMLC